MLSITERMNSYRKKEKQSNSLMKYIGKIRAKI
jgi:hypothetical protein